ncbi:dTMP kinase [Thalassotalea euphylliae]|uniref:Thymidylate kinase n=1 Tax=Thalassotalea euphylliae TaxID=1655234 RepID=A0A3E0TZ60_9GAMM|nr:dTMP kinase [Thalassotalea euphylliae]REL29730.1 dTMP kinase [Thalassotalea euphylliae]
MTQGKFIVVEGMEGAGKSSAIHVITDYLSQQNISFIQTREPGGTKLAEQLRDIVKSADHQETITQETELLLMYASRSQLLANVIQPALANGTWVIGDRHDLSSRAYQGGGRQIADEVMNTIADVTLKGFKPDLTLYLDIAPSIGLARARARGALDRIELEQMDFFERVHQKYQSLAAEDETIVSIDACQEMSKVHQDIKQALAQFVA